jgi:hypothetical protein
MNIKPMLNNELIPTKTFREKFFFDLMYDTNSELKIEQNLLRYNGELRDMVIFE